MKVPSDELQKLLLDSGLVSHEDFSEIEKTLERNPDQTLADALSAGGYISEDDLRSAQGYILGVPFISLEDMTIENDVLRLIPEPVARKHNIVAFKKTDEALEVAMLDPNDFGAIDELKKSTSQKIEPRLTNSASMKRALLHYQKHLKETLGEEIRELSNTLEIPEYDADEAWETFAETAPAKNFFEKLLEHAQSQNATDVHIEPLEDISLLRYRIHGKLHDAMRVSKNSKNAILARAKHLAGIPLSETSSHGQFYVFSGRARLSVRLSLSPTIRGTKIVFRLSADNGFETTLERLGLSGKMLEDFYEFTKHDSGMLLATGPRKSGKTTLLYTLLELLNTPDRNVATLEDPVEHRLNRVSQTAVNHRLGLDFESGLRVLTRQDPDVVMTSLVDDAHGLEHLARTSLAGRLTLSTFPAQKGTSAVKHIVEMGVSPFLLASALRLCVTTRLARRLSKNAREFSPSKALLEKLGKHADMERVLERLKDEDKIKASAKISDIVFFTVNDPENAAKSYDGHIGIFEVLKITEGIKPLIEKKSAADKLEKQMRAEGGMTLFEDGVFKAARGLTTLEEVFRVTLEK